MKLDDSAHGAYKDPSVLAGAKDAEEIDEEVNVKNRTFGKGTWYQAGWHIATTIGTPAAFAALPFAFATLGWEAGVISLVAAWATAYYNSILLASLHRYGGHRHVRFSTLAKSIYGTPGEWIVLLFQQVASIGNNLGVQIAAGFAMKSVYLEYNPDGTALKLWHFIFIFGVFEYFLSQLPEIHSLRHINSLCTAATYTFVGAVVAGAIINGMDTRDTVDYALLGDSSTIAWNVFSGLGIVLFAFGDTILPEVQATVQHPHEREMYKGVTLAFFILLSSYMPVSVSAYWAFGNASKIWIVDNFAGPSWLKTLANIAAITQIVGCYQIYCRPTYEWIDNTLQDREQGPFSRRNVLCRLLVTTIYSAVMTTLAAMLPFFADFLALVGAIGFTPIDYVFPILLYTKANKPGALLTAFNWTLATVFMAIGGVAGVSAVKLIVEHVAQYSLFADI